MTDRFIHAHADGDSIVVDTIDRTVVARCDQRTQAERIARSLSEIEVAAREIDGPATLHAWEGLRGGKFSVRLTSLPVTSFSDATEAELREWLGEQEPPLALTTIETSDPA